MLVVDVFADQVSQFRTFFGTSELSLVEGVLVGMEVLLFFDHVLDI